MTFLTQGKNSYFLTTDAIIVDHSKEMASEWAQAHIVSHPYVKWILGNFVEADNANLNKQYFSLDNLIFGQPTIASMPMNINHLPGRIVGSFTSSEIIFPVDDSDGIKNPFIEALGALWKGMYPQESQIVEEAFRKNMLSFSMEAIPEEINFVDTVTGSQKTFPFKGSVHPAYGDWNYNENAIRKAIRPSFVGGALIIPPLKPGWKKASVKEISKMILENSEKAEAIYNDFAAQKPELDPKDWEMMMIALLTRASI